MKAEPAPRWNGWSPTLDNARFQAQTALDARTVARLEPKWAFQFTGGLGSQPTVVGGRIYFATGSGAVYALDARAGCQHWRAEVKGGVRAAVTVAPLSGGSGRLAVFIGDRTGGVHALDAATGQEIWTTKVDSHPFATITAAPALYRGRIYVPVSSSEEISSLLKGYHCCTFRGHVTALDAATGKVLWTTYTIPETPEPYRLDPKGSQLYGPAGAAIWSSPTIDTRRGALYVATGDSYSDAPNTGSDAVMAMDLVTGHLHWSRQVTQNDNYLVGCTGKADSQPAACPRTVGDDYDFGASPVLAERSDGRGVLMVGQKSGAVTALDPDRQGRVLWQTQVGLGSALGGVEWGMAADRQTLFVPIADPYAPRDKTKAGMYGLDIGDGRIVWSNPAPAPNCAVAPKGSLINICTSGLSTAPTAIEGAVIEGSLDGVLRAYGARRLGETMLGTCRLAQRLAARVDAEPELERLAPVPLNIVCFRYRAGEDSDRLNAELVTRLQESGVAAPSTTRIGGRLAIRAAIVGHRTGAQDVDILVEAVLDLGRRLSKPAPIVTA